MGFDARWIRQPEHVREAQTRLVSPLTEMQQAGDVTYDEVLRRLSPLFEAVETAEREAGSTFGCPNRTWFDLVDQMAALGMLNHDPRLPMPDLTLLGYHGPCACESLADPNCPPAALSAIEDWLGQVPSSPGIARFKLTTNDGFVVTPSEIRSVQQHLTTSQQLALPTQPLPGRWDEWVRFLTGALHHDGFRVT